MFNYRNRMSVPVMPEYFHKILRIFDDEDPLLSQLFYEVVGGYAFVEKDQEGIPYTADEGFISIIDSLSMTPPSKDKMPISQALRLTVAFTKAKIVNFLGVNVTIKV